MSLFSKGSILKWNGQKVAQMDNIAMPELTRDMLDDTTHDTPDAMKHYIATLIEGGDVTFTGNSDPSDTNGQLAMLADFYSGTERTAEIVAPDSSYSLSFPALVSKIKPLGDAPINGKVAFSASVKVNGKPTMNISNSTGMTAVALSNSAVLAPAFAAGTYEYVATVLTGISSLTITPTAATGTITITANGVSQTVTTGVASSAISLGAAGSVTTITITVKETGKVAKVYTIRVVRAAS